MPKKLNKKAETPVQSVSTPAEIEKIVTISVFTNNGEIVVAFSTPIPYLSFSKRELEIFIENLQEKVKTI